jgi:hypothetical protein
MKLVVVESLCPCHSAREALTAGAADSQVLALEGQAVATARDARSRIPTIALAGEYKWLREQ